MIPRVMAVDDVKRMRGGSQPHLMKCSDGEYYVVKFQNNPQGIKVLANEMLCTLLAGELGLPVPGVAIVEACSCLIRRSNDLAMQLGNGRSPCLAGTCFGSQHVDPSIFHKTGNAHKVFDLLPDELWPGLDNLADFAGMMVLDKWTCNTDGRQVVFARGRDQAKYHATMVDNGFCLNATEWSFPDSPRRGLYLRRAVYRGITGTDDFEPWLSRLEERMNLSILMGIVESIPSEWYGNDVRQLFPLLRALDRRRLEVRRLISKTLRNYPEVFSRHDTESKGWPVAAEIAQAP
jgi:hypothetical protein